MNMRIKSDRLKPKRAHLIKIYWEDNRKMSSLGTEELQFTVATSTMPRDVV